jgi:ATP phosphoribosyltransferase regulatory subunit
MWIGISMDMGNKALLPSGLVDLLPPDAACEAQTVELLIQEFEALGYERVKPPLAEFEISMFAQDPGERIASETFRLMDPYSQKMMALRSDATPQIARIAGSRLGNKGRPLRLAYSVDVLRVKGSQLRPDREFTKTGCELIGAHGVEADIEIAVLAIKSLKSIGVGNIAIDMALPPLVEHVYEAFGTKEHTRKRLDEMLENRDRGALEKEEAPEAKILYELVCCAGPVEKGLKNLAGANLPDEIVSYLEPLSEIAGGVKTALEDLEIDDVGITLDPVERRGFEYKTGFAFTVFAKGERGEIGRGGRYGFCYTDKDSNSLAETATGFTFYMDTLRRIIPLKAAKKSVMISSEEGWNQVAKLQSEGWIVVRCFGEECDGRFLKCTHKFEDGKICPLGQEDCDG